MSERTERDGRITADPSADRAKEIPEEWRRLDSLPGYRQLRVQRALADRVGVGNPYFRAAEGIARDTCVIAGRELINFSTYNYLGLNGHPAVAAAAVAAIERYGTSASASRVVSGERLVQRELEQALAALHGVEDAVVFVSGHATNVTVIGHLFGPRDLVVHDALVHNSVLEGARLARAQRHTWPHNDWRALDRFLIENRRRYERVLIAVEGLYSMDGDRPPLDRLVDIKRRHKALLMVDEAHAMGVLGEAGHGSVELHGLGPDDVDLWMGTLSKTFAAAGGYIAGGASLCEYLKYTAPGFVYSVGIAPPLAAASLAAIEVMRAEPERVRALADIGRFFLAEARARGLDTGHSMGHAITPIVVGSSIAAGLLSQAMLARGVNVLPIVHPAVPERTARLRFFLTSMHVETQVTQALDALAEEIARLRSHRNLPGLALAPPQLGR